MNPPSVRLNGTKLNTKRLYKRNEYVIMSTSTNGRVGKRRMKCLIPNPQKNVKER